MKFQSVLIVVKDIERSKCFYKDVLRLRITSDFGANVTLSGGVALQTFESWRGFIGARSSEISFNGKDAELYFEESDIEAFSARLNKMMGINYVHALKEQAWGQRVIRFYDPDCHIIEVGEDMKTVCRRLSKEGLTEQEICVKTMMTAAYVNSSIK